MHKRHHNPINSRTVDRAQTMTDMLPPARVATVTTVRLRPIRRSPNPCTSLDNSNGVYFPQVTPLKKPARRLLCPTYSPLK